MKVGDNGNESMKFTRIEMLEFFEDTRAKSIFASLRRANLGIDTTIHNDHFANKYGKNETGTLRNYYVFNVDICINHYKKVMKRYKSNPFRQANNCVLKSYKNIIEDFENFKKYLSRIENEKA